MLYMYRPYYGKTYEQKDGVREAGGYRDALRTDYRVGRRDGVAGRVRQLQEPALARHVLGLQVSTRSQTGNFRIYCLCIYSFFYLFRHYSLHFIYLSIYLLIYLSIYQSIWISFSKSIYLSTYLSLYLFPFLCAC